MTTSHKYNEAQHRLHYLNSMQAVVSHEMKAPLNSITSSLTMILQQNMVSTPEATSLLKELRICSKKLYIRVSNLLDRHLITSKNMDSISLSFMEQIQTFSLTEAIDDVIAIE